MKIKLLTVMIMASMLFASCGTPMGKAEEKEVPYGFTIITSDFNNILRTLKHEKTGCYYAFVSSGSGKSITQMFVEKNGVSVPYCPKDGE